MKKLIIIFGGIILLFHQSYGQKIGIGIAYATTNTLNGEFLYSKDNHIFKLGVSIQSSDRRGEVVENQLSNYGQTTDGSGEYFLTVDLGYGKIVKDNWTFDGELSIGSNSHYTNYIDNRFTDGGYHMITSEEFVFGLGVNAGYIIKDQWNLFAGFNTNRKLQFGLRIWL